MAEKRRFPRFPCKIKAKFNYYEGTPDEIDYEITVPGKGKGVICDISQGGALVITSARVAVGVPALLNFKIKKNKHAVHAQYREDRAVKEQSHRSGAENGKIRLVRRFLHGG